MAINNSTAGSYFVRRHALVCAVALTVHLSLPFAVEIPLATLPKLSGNVLACGQGEMGQLGMGEDVMEKTRPAVIEGLSDVVQISAGGMHNLCLTRHGTVYSFGCNDEGALGRDTSEEGSEFEPKQIDLPGQCVKISAGDSHSACLLDDGRVYAWGSFRVSWKRLDIVDKK